MKIFDIALKDLTRSFRSAFALVFMFGIPLLMTGMFSLMFGDGGDNGEGFSLPVTRVVIANLDAGSPELQDTLANMPLTSEAGSLGEMVAGVLQSEEFSSLMEVSLAQDADSARAAVDSQEAGVALIIPPDFSAQFAALDGQATIEFYQDPTLTVGPGIVRSVLNQFLDRLSGAKIVVKVALSSSGSNYAIIGQVIQGYLAAQPQADMNAALIDVRSPNLPAQPKNVLYQILTPIMGGMMIFYAFFTGASTAESILKEDEEKTLPRLFTTPTPQSTILAGKFLAVFLTVLVQVVVLLLAGRLIFKIDWGSPLFVTLVAVSVIVTASTFGIFLNSLMKSTKQGGMIFGGVLTITGMLGMIPIFMGGTIPNAPWLETAMRLVPQGWAVIGMFQALNHVPFSEVLLNTLIMLAWSAAFFTIGVWRFQRRYA